MCCSPKLWVNPGEGEEVALPLRYDDISGATDLKQQMSMPLGVLGFGTLELEGKIQLGEDSRLKLNSRIMDPCS